MDKVLTCCRILVASLVGGCAYTLPPGDPTPTAEHDRIIDIVTTEWDRHPHLERQSDRCLNERDHIRVWVIGGDDFEGFCGLPGCGPGVGSPCWAGCFRYFHKDPRGALSFLNQTQPGIAVVPLYESHGLIHETLHWLADCAMGDSDADHSNPNIWGTEKSVLERATLQL